jgi:GNAT superfamily N-acetyltransferase
LIQERDLEGQHQQLSVDHQLEVVKIRPAIPEDADGIAKIFLESAEHHSSLDSQLYFVPEFETIVERYRERRQHPIGTAESITLVVEFDHVIVGFADACLVQSSDAMHRNMVFCHVAEIAVSLRHQCKGIGAQLLQAVEEWGCQHGASIALLDFHSANSQASAFYQRRMGYRATSITVIKNL